MLLGGQNESIILTPKRYFWVISVNPMLLAAFFLYLEFGIITEEIAREKVKLSIFYF